MAYDLAKVTTNGNNLIAQILANKSSLSIDKIEISDTQLPSTTDISTMTSVPKVVQTVSANGFSKNSNTLIVSTVVDNSSIRADYKAWVFGIWGSDSQNGQSQLIAVITSTNSPDTIPAFSGRTPVSYTYKFNIGFSNASQIKFKMINGSFATNDTVVHTTGDETIDGQKKFKTDPTDSAGNAYAKTVDVNQQLDKKVNIADMRKPASDVAGIEEVNAKQDSIGYTPANDKDVVHKDPNSGNTSENVNFTGKVQKDNSDLIAVSDMRKPASDVAGIEEVNAKQDKIGYTPADDSKVLHSTVTQLNSTDMNTVLTAGFYKLASGTNGMPNADSWTIYQVIPLSNYNGVQLAYETNNTVLGMRSWKDTESGLTFSNWIQVADDSKVARLSGANNFDTVPTVDNNPLLLASSLPSDLARLSHDANFTAKLQQNGQDVALANNAIARNPNTGSVSETNTFTAQQTFSIAPTIKDASKDKGDNQAATMADLKSVEKSAWRQLENVIGGTLLYKIDQSSNIIYMLYSLNTDSYSNSHTTIADFSSIVKNIETISGLAYMEYEESYSGNTTASAASLLIDSPASIAVNGLGNGNVNVNFSDGAYFTYDSLVN